MRNGQPAPATPGSHPIQVAAQRAGISVHLLRAWERRYGAVVPERSPTGRRLYSDADIERLRLLNQAVDGGRRIGDVAGLTTAQLSRMVDEDRVERRSRPAAAVPPIDSREPVEIAFDAIRRFDHDTLRSVFARSLATTSLPEFVDRIARPLMQRVGALWERGELSPSHEHLASATLRSALGDLLERVTPARDAPAVVVATTAGQRHELGALLAALTAALAGWRPIYLGADLPPDDIARAANESGAVAVALSITEPSIKPDLSRLRERLTAEVPILVGGQGVRSIDTPYPAGTRRLDSLADFRSALLALAS